MSHLRFALGLTLALLPFVVITYLGVKSLGFWTMMGCWAITVAIIAAIVGGTALMGSSS